MKIFSASLQGDIYWRIYWTDPVQQDLRSLPGLFFINPLAYTGIDEYRSGVGLNIMAVADDSAVVRTNGVWLGTKETEIDLKVIPFKLEAPEVSNVGPDRAFDPSLNVIYSYVEHLAVGLRLKSRQVDIPRSFLGGTWIDCEDVPILHFPRPNPEGEVLFQRYLWDTAVTWKHLMDADTNLVDNTTAVYEGLVLDAIHAFRSRDYRRALLYSAISIETAVATKLDEVAKSKSANDPVYEFLSEKGRFAEHLHEIPLYVIGKSLRIENESLYQTAVKLYRTRNKIAHLGEPPSNEQAYFEIDEKSALSGIECTLQILQWLGERADFPIPRFDFVRLRAPTIRIKVGG